MKSTSSKHKKSIDEIDNDNASLSIVTSTKPIEWSVENEMILVEWCDFAQCYKWLHNRSHSKFSFLHAALTIPAIVLSTFSGTASFALSSIPPSFRTYTPMIIGAVNICVGIITTLQQYLKVAELNESHRIATIAWDKFARNIRIELAKAPAERMDAAHFLKLNRQEFDRLMETSPIILDSIVDEFRYHFMGEDGSIQRNNYDSLKKPDICDTITSVNENRHHWYLEQRHQSPKLDALNLDIKNKEDENAEAVEKMKRMQEKLKSIATENANQAKQKKIDEYVNTFVDVYGRQPLKEELTEHFKDDNNIFENDIVLYLDKKIISHLPSFSMKPSSSEDSLYENDDQV